MDKYLLTEGEIEELVREYEKSSVGVIRLMRGHHEDITPLVAQAQLAKAEPMIRADEREKLGFNVNLVGKIIFVSHTHHWLIKSPFVDGEPWWAGLTPKGITGWNGEPDIYVSAPTLVEAVDKAIVQLKQGMKP